VDIDHHLKVIGGLSSPSKMPCYSYSLPAKDCILGSKLAQLPGTTCHGCYALKGFYVMPNVKAAMERRLAIVKRAMHDTHFRPRFVVRWGCGNDVVLVFKLDESFEPTIYGDILIPNEG